MFKAPKRYRFGKIAKCGGSIMKGVAGGLNLEYGEYGLIALEPGRISSRQLEAARRTIRRAMLRSGQLWARLRPSVPVTKKPIEVRMGGGSGSIKYWAAMVKPGMVMFEVFGVDETIALHALSCGAHKLPIRCKLVHRSNLSGIHNNELVM